MLPRDSRMLQILLQQISEFPYSKALGTAGPGEGCVTDKVRGRSTSTSGPGYQSWAVCSRDPGRRTNTDRERQSDGAGNIRPKERSRLGYGTLEAVVNDNDLLATKKKYLREEKTSDCGLYVGCHGFSLTSPADGHRQREMEYDAHSWPGPSHRAHPKEAQGRVL